MKSTILFGNGINRLIPSNISWNQLLDKIKGTNKFKDDILPNTMIYERIVLQRLTKKKDILLDEYEVKSDIATLLEDISANEIYLELFNINAQHYITTNYDYGFVTSILSLPEILTPIEEYSTEDVYSIRRLKRIKNSNELEKNFWQIHGEIRKPATIMLGLDHYCGSIGRIDRYIKGSYRYSSDGKEILEGSIEQKFNDNSFNNSSWIELFFTSNIHIIGFTFDFSEIDLWWILNKRARMMKSESLSKKIKNEIHFYCNEIEEQKKSLFESMSIIVHVIKLPTGDDIYVRHYRQLINLIRNKLTSR
jgi:hypothetical protein